MFYWVGMRSHWDPGPLGHARMSRQDVTYVTPGCHACHARLVFSSMAAIKRGRHPWWEAKTMQTDTYLTLHSGTADANDFTTPLNPSLMVGERWEVAVAQAHIPHGTSHFMDRFQWTDATVVGALRVIWKTAARDDVTMDGDQQSVLWSDIKTSVKDTTSQADVLKMIYAVAWNKIVAAQKATVGKRMHLRTNKGEFIPMVFKDTPRGLKLEGTQMTSQYFQLKTTLAEGMGLWKAGEFGPGVHYETRSLADMNSRFPSYPPLYGNQLRFDDQVDWYFPLATNKFEAKRVPVHVDVHCDVVRAQHANGQILLAHAEMGGGTLTPTMRSYIPLAHRELKTIRIWITETGTDTKVTLPNQKTRITLHLRKTL